MSLKQLELNQALRDQQQALTQFRDYRVDQANAANQQSDEVQANANRMAALIGPPPPDRTARPLVAGTDREAVARPRGKSSLQIDRVGRSTHQPGQRHRPQHRHLVAMCFGSGPRAPEIRHIGLSQADIDANRQALDFYRQQSMQQQQQFASAVQAQIDQANAQAEAYRDRLEEEEQTSMAELEAQRTGAAAEAAAQRQADYAVTTTEAEPLNAQTTRAPRP